MDMQSKMLAEKIKTDFAKKEVSVHQLAELLGDGEYEILKALEMMVEEGEAKVIISALPQEEGSVKYMIY